MNRFSSVRCRRSTLAVLAIACAASSSVHAAEARIDFGLFGNNYQTASTSGKNWNNVTNPLFGQTKLVDYSTGSATSWIADITKPFNGLYDLNGATALGGVAAQTLNATAAKDSFTDFTSFSTPQITFRNLVPTDTYNFSLLGSTLGTKSNTAATYTAKGATTAIGSLNATNNKTDLVNLSGVRPTAAGTITLDIAANVANTSAWKQVFLNALTVTNVKPAPPAAPTAKNLLFFGNSFTAMYDVPDLVGTIAVADGKLKPYVVGETSDSRDLSDQIAVATSSPQNNVANLPAGQHWDNVVMQDYSSRPTHNGTSIDGGIAGFRADAKTLYNLVKAGSPNVTPVLYETWAYRTDSPSTIYTGTGTTPGDGQWTDANQMQAELKSSYGLAKTDLDAIDGNSTILASVGDKWQQAGFTTDLYGDFDAKHPSVRGAALNGLVLYASIYHENVSDIPFAKIADWANQYGLTQADWTRLTAIVDANPTLLQGASMAQLSAIANFAIPEPTSLAAIVGLAATLIRRRRA